MPFRGHKVVRMRAKTQGPCLPHTHQQGDLANSRARVKAGNTLAYCQPVTAELLCRGSEPSAAASAAWRGAPRRARPAPCRARRRARAGPHAHPPPCRNAGATQGVGRGARLLRLGKQHSTGGRASPCAAGSLPGAPPSESGSRNVSVTVSSGGGRARYSAKLASSGRSAGACGRSRSVGWRGGAPRVEDP